MYISEIQIYTKIHECFFLLLQEAREFRPEGEEKRKRGKRERGEMEEKRREGQEESIFYSFIEDAYNEGREERRGGENINF